MNVAHPTDDRPSVHTVAYRVGRHLKRLDWWARHLAHADGDRGRAADSMRLADAALRAATAAVMPGELIAYRAGVVRGKWAGE